MMYCNPFKRALVVNNIDEEQPNSMRIRVRVLGVHPFPNTNEADGSTLDAASFVPDEVLPWAEKASLVDGPVDKGYGRRDVPNVGDWVWIFFEDEGYQKPHYFAIITTINDIPQQYKQSENIFEKDRFDNTATIDKDGYEWVNGSKTVSVSITEQQGVVTLKTKGNINIQCEENSLINMGGEQASSSLVNWTGLMAYLKALETWLATHIHTGNIGLPTSPSTVPIDAVSQLQSGIETEKIKVPIHGVK